jgi:hypothetical protein
MIKTYYASILFVIALFLSLFFITCGDDSVNAPQDFVSGTITYLDTNINVSTGHYSISIYGDSTNPFSHHPIRTDSVAVNINNGTATAYYKVTGLTAGHYYIGATWVNRSNGIVTVYGVYGCDQNINCTNPTKIEVPNYAGTGGLNFKSATH